MTARVTTEGSQHPGDLLDNKNNFYLLVSYYKLKRAEASVLRKVPPR
jgi:hypothetical protein